MDQVQNDPKVIEVYLGSETEEEVEAHSAEGIDP
jgi:hypothetical protein